MKKELQRYKEASEDLKSKEVQPPKLQAQVGASTSAPQPLE